MSCRGGVKGRTSRDEICLLSSSFTIRPRGTEDYSISVEI